MVWVRASAKGLSQDNGSVGYVYLALIRTARGLDHTCVSVAGVNSSGVQSICRVLARLVLERAWQATGVLNSLNSLCLPIGLRAVDRCAERLPARSAYRHTESTDI